MMRHTPQCGNKGLGGLPGERQSDSSSSIGLNSISTLGVFMEDTLNWSLKEAEPSGPVLSVLHINNNYHRNVHVSSFFFALDSISFC